MNNETRRKMMLCGLTNMIEIIESQEINIKDYLNLSFDERLNLIIDNYYQRYYTERIKRRIKQAHLRYGEASIDTIDFKTKNIDLGKLKELCIGNFLNTYTNIIITGYPSSGKTNLACAIAKELCKKDIKCLYYRLPELIQDLQENRRFGKQNSFIKRITYNKLLIIDEWLTYELNDDSDINLMFELIEKLYEKTSVVLITLYPKEAWHERIANDAIAESIMERLIHNAIYIDCGNKNMRESIDKAKAYKYNN